MATEAQLIEALRRADAAGETADAQQIANAIKTMRSGQAPITQPQQAAAAPARSARLGSAIAQGASFGFADEATSGLFAGTVGTGKGVVNAIRERDIGEIPKAIGREFNDLQTFQREEREAFRRERPVTSTVAEIGGALATGGVGALKSGTLKAAAATGAIQGGLYGAGATTGGLEERAKGAAIGAGIGAAAAPAFQFIANKAGQFFNARRSGQIAPDDTKRAFDAMRDLLEYDLGSRSKAEAALRVWMKNGGNPDEIFDIAGPSLQNLQREIAAQRPSSAVEFVNRIRTEASDDVRGVVAGSISKTDQSVRASRAALKIARQSQAGPLFRAAEQTPVPDGFADDLISQRPAVRGAVQKAARELANSQEATPFNVLKVAKENLDDMVSAHIRAGRGAEARRIMIPRDELRSRLSQLSPEYAQGLDIWAGSKAADDALDLGKKFLNTSYAADDLAADIGSMTQSEKEFLRVGVAEQLENALDNIKDGATAGRRFAQESFRRKVRILFDDPTDAQAFIDVVKKAEERALKAQRIDPFSGSQTEPRLRAREAFDKASQGRIEQATDVLSDGIHQLPKKAIKAATKATRGARGERVSDILEDVFFGSGGARLQPATKPQVQIPYRAGPQANIVLQSNTERSQ